MLLVIYYEVVQGEVEQPAESSNLLVFHVELAKNDQKNCQEVKVSVDIIVVPRW